MVEKIDGKFTTLLRERRKNRENQLRVLSPEQQKLQDKKWTTFYRRNWEIYAQEELGLTLHVFQQYTIHQMGQSEAFFEQCSRGLSKTFMADLAAVIQCMLYPYSEVVLTATTIKTATKTVKEKIETELCTKYSPKLKWLYKKGLIKFSYSQEEVRVDFLFNGSWIKVLPEAESSLGERSCFTIFEEVRKSKRYFVDRVFMPMSRPRQAQFLSIAEYQDNNGKPLPIYIEPAKTIYLTSTSYKHEWFFGRWKMAVEGFFNQDTSVRWNILCGDIFTAMAHGIKTQQDYDTYKTTMSDAEFRMEILNEPIGEVEGSYYSLEEFKRNAVILEGFVPPTDEEWVFKFFRGEAGISCHRERNEGELRIIYVDFAFTDTVKTKQKNDNTIIGCMAIYPNENQSKMYRNVEYMETFSGGKKDESIQRIRELFDMYEADVILLDLRNGGEDRFIDLTKPFYHETWGKEMQGFGVYEDNEILDRFIESSKVANLRSRVVDTNPRNVIIPVIGTDERNNNFHISMKKALENNIIRFLMDEMQVKQELEENVDFLTLESEQLMRRLLGHVQINLMMEEACQLEQELVRGFIKLKEPNSITYTKDRIVATEYANYFAELMELKMIKDAQKSQFDVNDWDCLAL